jgi:predicted DNA-binding transcriptional regulator AlpA
MKPTPLQFDVRENTASSRQHASRLAVNLSTPMSHRLQTDQSVQVSPPSSVPKEAHQSALDQNAAAIAATGGKKADDVQLLSVQEVASLLHVPVSWVYEHTRPRCATPLPHIKLGKYLRFLPTDIRTYLEDARSVHRVLR